MRLIDADELLKKAYKSDWEWHDRLHKEKQKVVDVEDIAEAPTIEAEPVKHGRWIDNNNKTWSCSICQSWIPDEQHSYARYCLHCGAKMDGGVNE